MSKETALVTGASGGIGLEFARQLSAKGCNVILASRSREKLEKIKTELESRYDNQCFVIPADLSETDGASKLYKACAKENLKVDILINNAGAGGFRESIHFEEKAVNALLNLNILSLTNLCNLFGRDMAARGRGHILNVASVASMNAIPYFASYSASKGYVYQFSIALRNELKDKGVAVTCLLPGFVRTDFDANARITSKAYMEMSHKSGMEPDRVARIGLKGMFKKKTLITAGVGNKITVFFAGLFPMTLTSGIMKGYLKKFL